MRTPFDRWLDGQQLTAEQRERMRKRPEKIEREARIVFARASLQPATTPGWRGSMNFSSPNPHRPLQCFPQVM